MDGRLRDHTKVPKMYEKNLAFRGICIYVPMKKSVSGYTLLFNTFIPQHIPVLKKITLDYLSFRKNYQVYSNDQIEARVLLTPVFMEKLNNSFMEGCYLETGITQC